MAQVTDSRPVPLPLGSFETIIEVGREFNLQGNSVLRVCKEDADSHSGTVNTLRFRKLVDE